MYIRWFDDLKRTDIATVGGKGANLGEMKRAGLPVPQGFVVTVAAYRRFLESAGLESAIAARLAQLDVNDADSLRSTSEALQQLVRSAAMPSEVASAITDAYDRLGHDLGTDDPRVAARSSATAEDTAEFSFAGMFRSSLNLAGADGVIAGVKDCWASLHGARLLFYLRQQAVPGDVYVGVVVQHMVDAEKAGVLFTVDPASGNPDHTVIEAAWGLGDTVVSGQVTPDHYVVDRQTREIIERRIAHKEFRLDRDPETGETRRFELDHERADAPVLTDEEVQRLAELGSRAEAHYNAPQDIEWAIVGDSLHLVQTRPVTTLLHTEPRADRGHPVLVRGLGASPGVAAGRVRVLATPAEGGALERGEVLVARNTAPDWVPIMRRAAAIVTDTGGMTSHAAIVSRELGVPCLVGTRDATRVLVTGTEVTVDASAGTVVAGRVAASAGEGRDSAEARVGMAQQVATAAPVTATKLYVNLAEPERAAEVAAMPVDGVGLLRAEFMLLDALDNTHPRVLLREGRGDEFVARMAQKLVAFGAAFHPRPVIYRTMDFRSNEFRGLAGGEEIEPVEANPMIGYRGCYRYVREPDLFALELRAFRHARERHDNLHLMIPFVRTASEFRACRRLIDESGLEIGSRLQLWVMAEVPSVLYWLDEYVRLGATGVSIGSNDLTQLVLGIDRDSELVAQLFDERDPAVLDTIHRIIERCRDLGVTCSICGQAPSVYPEVTGRLVEWGIDSISVNVDAIDATRRHIAAAEQRLLLGEARRTAAG